MPSVPELAPQDVGTPVPVSPHVPAETYTYDYIIVGGGTAGSVLASRLSEDPSVSVLVIEQGPVADTWASRVPVISGNPYRDGTLATTWWSLPMPQVNGRALQVMRGEALGGTSRINSLLYTRGPPGDYNRWKELGCEGWGYDDLQPFFVRSEDTISHPSSKFRGKKGPWQNRQFITFPYTVLNHVITAISGANIKHIPDLNDPSAPAAAAASLDVIEDKKYERASTYRAFLPPNVAQERKARLKICTNSIAMRVEFAEEDGKEIRAKGVHFEAMNPRKAGQTFYVEARREIVLSAGALGSPQLLMLSGIGPKEHLEEKGVPVLRDMPAVGSHLQDHIGVPLTYEVPMSDSLHQLENSKIAAIKAALNYLLTGRGLFSNPFQSMTIMVPTHLLNDNHSRVIISDPAEVDASVPSKRPDIELMPLGLNSTDADIPGKGIFTLLPTLILPKSEGSVRLATSNPRAKPDVDLGFFEDPMDYVPLRKGMRLALSFAEAIRHEGYPLKDLIVPESNSDEDLERFIRKNLRDCFHYTSTCRMGAAPHGPHPSVVDQELRVHGVRGLRVCDTSVFPEIVSSHTMAPAVVVAEKCAELMKVAAGKVHQE
ncbi:alcohol oxidase [Pilatotrama ljubarskyi]|nr:alcohol oxidase [Pilatotrama ljubarskyi]